MDTPVLVIGSGIAGLTYALKVAEHAPVVLVTKKEHTESNTNYAQGGIATVMAVDDSPELHIQDTLTAGAGLCHLDAVTQMVREGPERVRELIAWGAQFSRDPRSEGAEMGLALGREGGHTRRRIVHAQDRTGQEVERALVAAVQCHSRIRVLEHHAAVDLLLTQEAGVPAVVGAAVLDVRMGRVDLFPARVTVLATGGCGHIYLHTTNPAIATGDGVAMAYRAGAATGNLEFIQFHPTTLYHPEARSFLISEAVRGEGGILKLRNGTPFMDAYHPMGCLAPRDVVARAIDSELKRTGDDYVLLDVTHLEPERVRHRFPQIYERCLSLGLDITREPIPVVPAAHYSCGGVVTDLRARASLRRLYAVGETACTGVHGANRLASNSLLEALVFAHHAARDTQEFLAEPAPPLPSEAEALARAANDPHRRANEVSPEFVAQMRRLVQTLMLSHVGIVRTDGRLDQALREVTLVRNAVEALFPTVRLTADLVELRNIAQVAQLIIRGALMRRESRGLHCNTDCPDRDDEHWQRDTILRRGDGE
ncbi:MAG: L-aspartate oxidase [Armatimonadetes bacterium]|nr:L-aspartate oxidase [Armatimonadota bacterium]